LTNGTLVWTSPSVNAVLALAFSMDARVLVSAESDGQIRMWDAASGRLLQTLEEHAGLIFSVVWSPDGKILARDGYDPHIRLWELAEDDSGEFKFKPIKTLNGHTHMVWGLAFSPDGRKLASASWDMTVRFWDVGQEAKSIPLQFALPVGGSDGRYLRQQAWPRFGFGM
jgi:WD40 repeat protein